MNNLEKWRYIHSKMESPMVFVDWAFYGMVSSCLQSRIWLNQRGHTKFTNVSFLPNIYAILVGKPGIGKSISAYTSKLFINKLPRIRRVRIDGPAMMKQRIHVAPDSITPQALLVCIAKETRVIQDKNNGYFSEGPNRTTNPLAFLVCDEFGSLLSQEEGTKNLVTFLNHAWDGRAYNRVTKTQGSDIIKNPRTTMIACCTPDWVQDNMNNNVLKQGFAARSIWIFGDQKRAKSLFYTAPEHAEQYEKEILEHLTKISEQDFFGPCFLTEEAEAWYSNWYKTESDNYVNNDPKLQDYYSRKKAHIIKLAMVIHYSDNLDNQISLSTLQRAKNALEEVEPTMHIAMCASGGNKNKVLADRIIHFIKKKGFATRSEIIMDMYDDASVELTEKTIEELLQLDRLKVAFNGEKGCYKINESRQEQDNDGD